jgi:outer membrane protein OmpA-like peptidoglycan-associated protein
MASLVLAIAMAKAAHAVTTEGRFALEVNGSWPKRVGTEWRHGADKDSWGAGGALAYGWSPHWEGGMSFDSWRLERDLRVEPVILFGTYRFMSQGRWTPFVRAGVGSASGDFGGTFTNVATRVGVGVEYFLAGSWSLGAQADHWYVSSSGDAEHEIRAATAGLFVRYYFGAGTVVAPVQKSAIALSVVASTQPYDLIHVDIHPPEVSLKAGDFQQFEARVPGASDPRVFWNLTPPLGVISANGLYQAPIDVLFKQDIWVAAKSEAAHRMLYERARVHLKPSTDKPVEINMHVVFDAGQYEVARQYDAEIEKVAKIMECYPDAIAVIEGHTDNRGSSKKNQELSEKRASAIRDQLIYRFGVDRFRLYAKGFGSSKPEASNDTPEGRRANRRVVAVLGVSPPGEVHPKSSVP